MKEKQRKYEIMIAEKKLKSHFLLYKMGEQKIKFKVTTKTFMILKKQLTYILLILIK